MSAKRYGPAPGQPGVALSEYHQSKDELAGLPVTVAEKIPVTNTPGVLTEATADIAEGRVRLYLDDASFLRSLAD